MDCAGWVHVAWHVHAQSQGVFTFDVCQARSCALSVCQYILSPPDSRMRQELELPSFYRVGNESPGK